MDTTTVILLRHGDTVVISDSAPCSTCSQICMINPREYDEVVQYVPRDERACRAFAESLDMRIVDDYEIDLSPVSDAEGRILCSTCSEASSPAENVISWPAEIDRNTHA